MAFCSEYFFWFKLQFVIGCLILFVPLYIACGVCHSDLHVIKGEIPFSSPCVIGHEITGEVVEHGQHTNTKIIKRCKYIIT